MAGVAEQIKEIRTHIPSEVTLVCVSKFQPVEAIEEAYAAGERDFGESRVQELQRKVPLLPADIRWHFIGHLQTNKVRDLIKLRPYLIQSVDSIHLLESIQNEAAKQGIIQSVLLEVHVAKETTKTGFSIDEILHSFTPSFLHSIPNIRILGYMSMATNTDDEEEIRRCFTAVRNINKDGIMSFGMSDDYRIAIDCGSTMVRIGSAIFGERRKMPKAVFFDQDGVLFDSMPFHAKSWELAMNENGLPFTKDQTYRNEGRTGASVINEAYRLIHGVDAPQEVIEAVYAAKSGHFNRLTGGKLPNLIPGIRELLTYLHDKGIQCWVVTGSGQRSLLENLNTTFPGIFTGIITAYDVQFGKPNPEPYLKAWERSGFDKSECYVVENAPLGVRAGKAAGLFTIAVNTGILPDSALTDEGADKVFPSMAALLEWIKQ
jgi:pyridoxal phosphate enzyme (YggS family)